MIAYFTYVKQFSQTSKGSVAMQIKEDLKENKN